MAATLTTNYQKDLSEENVWSAPLPEIRGGKASFNENLGPSSMSFRDGNRVPNYKDDTFSVASGARSCEVDIRRKGEVGGKRCVLMTLELVGEWKASNENRHVDKVAVGLAEIEKCLMDSIEDIKAARQSIIGE